MLVSGWDSVCDAGPALHQHWLNIRVCGGRVWRPWRAACLMSRDKWSWMDRGNKSLPPPPHPPTWRPPRWPINRWIQNRGTIKKSRLESLQCACASPFVLIQSVGGDTVCSRCAAALAFFIGQTLNKGLCAQNGDTFKWIECRFVSPFCSQYVGWIVPEGSLDMMKQVYRLSIKATGWPRTPPASSSLPCNTPPPPLPTFFHKAG